MSHYLLEPDSSTLLIVAILAAVVFVFLPVTSRGLLSQTRWRRVIFLVKCAAIPAVFVFYFLKELFDPASYDSNSSNCQCRPGLWEKCPCCGSRRIYNYLYYSS